MPLVPPMAVLFLAALCGCVSTHPRGPAEAVGTAGQQDVQAIHYRLDEGFVPARLDVETGTRVVLVNESGAPLTPGFAQRHGHAHTDRHGHSGGATDHHGAHGARTGPGQPVWTPDDPEAGGDRWAHSFRVSGYWRYRNELNPKHSGLVVALPGPGGADAELEPLAMEGHVHTFVDPPRPTFHESMRLLRDQEFLRQFMKAHGPANTLEVLRQAEVETGLDCHHGAHHLGRMAFAEYGPSVSASIADTCQSGMRHGVMEQLFVTRGTASLAADVASMCPPPARAFARYQCLHGVGHGATGESGVRGSLK